MSNIDDILYKSDAYKNIRKYKIFLNAVKIYEGNYCELIKSFERHKKLDLTLLLDTKYGRKKLYNLHNKISRNLHNYIASTFTLIRATSVYYKDSFESKNLISDYKSKIEKEVNNQPVKFFIEDLRTYLQHKEIPDITTSTVYEPSPSQDYNSYIIYNANDLLIYKNWRSLSKKYIRDNSKSLNITKAIEEFHNIFSSFTNWFINQVNICLEIDRREINRLTIKMNTEKLKTLSSLYFKLENYNISIFEDTFLPRFKKGEKSFILKEKNPQKRAEKIIKLIKKYININIEFEENVYRIYK